MSGDCIPYQPIIPDEIVVGLLLFAILDDGDYGDQKKIMDVFLQETVSMVLLDYGLLCRKPKLCYPKKFGFVSSKPMFIAASVSIALQQFKPCFAKKRNTAFCEVSYLNQKPWLALRITRTNSQKPMFS